MYNVVLSACDMSLTSYQHRATTLTKTFHGGHRHPAAPSSLSCTTGTSCRNKRASHAHPRMRASPSVGGTAASKPPTTTADAASRDQPLLRQADPGERPTPMQKRARSSTSMTMHAVSGMCTRAGLRSPTSTAATATHSNGTASQVCALRRAATPAGVRLATPVAASSAPACRRQDMPKLRWHTVRNLQLGCRRHVSTFLSDWRTLALHLLAAVGTLRHGTCLPADGWT